MKAEHRKELHTNLLADRMGRLVKNMRSAPKSTSILVWVLLLLALGTIIVWQYSANATLATRSALWGELTETLRDPELLRDRVVEEGRVVPYPDDRVKELRKIGESNRGTLAGRAARFQAARLLFEAGQEGLTSTSSDVRSRAVKRIEEARELYKEFAPRERGSERILSTGCADAPVLAQEALMGVAKAEEALIGVAGSEKTEGSSNHFEEALAYYTELHQTYPKSVLGKQAKDRAVDLEEHREAIQKFYAELSRGVTIFKPKKDKEAEDKPFLVP